jgi:cytochrome bd-type quinol oxidase subunit 2
MDFKKTYRKYNIFILIILSFLVVGTMCQGALLSPDVDDKMVGQEKAFEFTSGYQATTEAGVASVIAMVIKGFLGLLGIIFVILLIIAGQKWMTAGGEEEKVNEAKDTIKRAIIGLIIIVAAYSITYFVFRNLGGIGDTTAF